MSVEMQADGWNADLFNYSRLFSYWLNLCLVHFLISTHTHSDFPPFSSSSSLPLFFPCPFTVFIYAFQIYPSKQILYFLFSQLTHSSESLSYHFFFFHSHFSFLPHPIPFFSFQNLLILIPHNPSTETELRPSCSILHMCSSTIEVHGFPTLHHNLGNH